MACMWHAMCMTHVTSKAIHQSPLMQMNTWLAMCPACVSPSTSSLPRVTWHVSSCHVSLDTRCLKKHEISTVSEFDEIQIGCQISQDDSNGEIHFFIRDLEKSQLFLLDYSDKLPFCLFSEKFKCKFFTGFTRCQSIG